MHGDLLVGTLTVHADGEIQVPPEDAIRELTIDILPERLRVKVCDPG
jgi:hypothetical protein